jgi:hypothetical protein
MLRSARCISAVAKTPTMSAEGSHGLTLNQAQWGLGAGGRGADRPQTSHKQLRVVPGPAVRTSRPRDPVVDMSVIARHLLRAPGQ